MLVGWLLLSCATGFVVGVNEEFTDRSPHTGGNATAADEIAVKDFFRRFLEEQSPPNTMTHFSDVYKNGVKLECPAEVPKPPLPCPYPSVYPNGPEIEEGEEFCEGGWRNFQDYFDLPDSAFVWPTRTVYGAVNEGVNITVQVPKRFCMLKLRDTFFGRGFEARANCTHLLSLRRYRYEDGNDWGRAKAFQPHNAKLPMQISGPVFSLIEPWDDSFPHIVCQSMAQLAAFLPSLAEHPTAKILVPSKGPTLRFVQAAGVPRCRIEVKEAENFFTSELHLFGHPHSSTKEYNEHHQQKGVAKMMKLPHGIMKGIQKNMIEQMRRESNTTDEPQNSVVFLWRNPNGLRGVVNTKELLDAVKKALKPEYKLEVLGERDYVSYQSKRSLHAWVEHAQAMQRAKVVFGPHGGAFGNVIFCKPETSVIEFALPPWSQYRDMFHSLAMMSGVQDYRIVVPTNIKGVQPTKVYDTMKLWINPSDVIQALRDVGVAS